MRLPREATPGALPQQDDGRRRLMLSAVCFLIWSLGILAGRVVGLWPGVGVAALLLGSLIWVHDRSSLLPLLRPSASLIAWGVGAGALQIVVTYVLYPPAARALPFVAPQTGELYATFGQATGLTVAVLLPLVILSEELVWRGTVQSAMQKCCEGRWRVVPAAVVYACAHLPAGPPLLPLLALACGLYWGALRARTGSLIAPLIAHFLWDLSVLIVAPLAPPDQLLALP